MDKNRIERNRKAAQKVIKGLESRNMEGFFADSREEALKIAMDLIPEGSSVGWGGSASVDEIGLRDALRAGNYEIHDRGTAKDKEEKRKIELECMDCDYFLSGTNAITQDGMMVNIDGGANRVAAIAWGPRNVIMIVGMNKVVATLEDAWSRARNEAAPINAQRFEIDTPCKKTGACADCKSPNSICCQFLVTRFSLVPKRIKVILVNDTMGY